MIYHVQELLRKMGAPDLGDKRRLEWYYFDKQRNELAGFAEIRLEAGGEFLVAELKRHLSDHTDDAGKQHARFEDSFFLYAERTARLDHYRVTRIAFDGEDYGHPTKPIIELGLGVFHARALDISIRMVEQTFNKNDLLDASTPAPAAPVSPENISPERTTGRSRRKDPRSNQRRDQRTISAEHVHFPAKSPQQEAYGVVVPFRPRASRLQAALGGRPTR